MVLKTDIKVTLMNNVLIVMVVVQKHQMMYQTCSHCNGTGTIRTQQRSPFGTFVNQTTCPDCHGTGKEVKEKCPHCHGKGYITKTVTVQLDIPAGINNGQQLRVLVKVEEDLMVDLMVTYL